MTDDGPKSTGVESVLTQVVNQLFAASLDVHQVLQRVESDRELTGRLRLVLTQFEDSISTILHADITKTIVTTSILQGLVTRSFAMLSEAVSDGLDISEYLRMLARHCVEVPSMRATAFLFDGPRCTHVAPMAHPDDDFLQQLLALRSGPAREAHGSEPRTIADFGSERRWPAFTARAVAAGYRAAHLFPVRATLVGRVPIPSRHRGSATGTLIAFTATPGALSVADRRILERAVDLATIGLTMDHAARVDHWTSALLSDTAVVHQAEGILAERSNITVAAAAAALADRAERLGVAARDLAEQIVRGNHDLPDADPT